MGEKVWKVVKWVALAGFLLWLYVTYKEKSEVEQTVWNIGLGIGVMIYAVTDIMAKHFSMLHARINQLEYQLVEIQKSVKK